jgi:hypothetical protein
MASSTTTSDNIMTNAIKEYAIEGQWTGTEPGVGIFSVIVDYTGTYYAIITLADGEQEEQDNMTRRDAKDFVQSFGIKLFN